MYPMRIQKLNKAIHIRLNEGDYEKVKKLAEGLALSPSAFLRMKIHPLLLEELGEGIFKDHPQKKPSPSEYKDNQRKGRGKRRRKK